MDIDTALDWRGRTVRDPDGDKIGTLGEIMLDEHDKPAWGTVKTGLFGRSESYVPLSSMSDRDGDLVVPFGADRLKDAPRADPDVALTADEEDRLYAHYGEQRPAPEMVRHEEEVRVEPGEMKPSERVTLKKVRVQTEETRTVPVRKEVVQLETEPPPEGQIEDVQDAGEAPRR